MASKYEKKKAALVERLAVLAKDAERIREKYDQTKAAIAQCDQKIEAEAKVGEPETA